MISSPQVMTWVQSAEQALVKTLLDAGAPSVDLGGYFGGPAHTAQTCQWYSNGDYPGVLAALAGVGTGSED